MTQHCVQSLGGSLGGRGENDHSPGPSGCSEEVKPTALPQLQQGLSRDDCCSQGCLLGEEEEAGDEKGVGWIEGRVHQAEGDGPLDSGLAEPSKPWDSD